MQIVHVCVCVCRAAGFQWIRVGRLWRSAFRSHRNRILIHPSSLNPRSACLALSLSAGWLWGGGGSGVFHAPPAQPLHPRLPSRRVQRPIFLERIDGNADTNRANFLRRNYKQPSEEDSIFSSIRGTILRAPVRPADCTLASGRLISIAAPRHLTTERGSDRGKKDESGNEPIVCHGSHRNNFFFFFYSDTFLWRRGCCGGWLVSSNEIVEGCHVSTMIALIAVDCYYIACS